MLHQTTDRPRYPCLLPWKHPILTFIYLPFKTYSECCELFKDRFFRSLSLCISQGGHVNNQFPFTPLPLNDAGLSRISDQALFIGIPWGQNSMMSYQNSRDLACTHRYATIFVCPEPVVSFPWFSTVSSIQGNKNNLPRLFIKVF